MILFVVAVQTIAHRINPLWFAVGLVRWQGRPDHKLEKETACSGFVGDLCVWFRVSTQFVDGACPGVGL